jgi:hypothetical protein
MPQPICPYPGPVMNNERNAPCPCGSGLKYKKCCQPREAEQGTGRRRMKQISDTPSIPPEILAALDRSVAWEADATAFPGVIEGTPTSRLVAVLVATQGAVLHARIEESPSAEPGDVAELLASAVRAATGVAGFIPPTVHVRHGEVAASMQALFGKALAVSARTQLPWASDVAKSLRTQATGVRPPPPPVASPLVWAGWGLPPVVVNRIFRAAAAFHRSEPWAVPAADFGLQLRWETGSEWTVLVMKSGADGFGLTLYERVDDFILGTAGSMFGAEIGDITGMVMTLIFVEQGDLPSEMRREVARSGWDIAGPRAHPLLVTCNTPGAGMPVRLAGELADALEALARWCAEHSQRPIETIDTNFSWHDADTGVSIGFTKPDLADLLKDGETRLWPLESPLVPCLPSGPGARPGEWLTLDATSLAGDDSGDDARRIDDEIFELVARFQEYLKLSRVSHSLREHTLETAEHFLEYLADEQLIRVNSVSARELRYFLFDWAPRKIGWRKRHMMAIPPALRRLFRFLEDSEGVVCEWAHGILMERAEFKERLRTRPVRSLKDPVTIEWRQLLARDLSNRVLTPPPELATDLSWHGLTGIDSARLYLELTRRWLVWRDEAIRAGTDDVLDVWEYCVERQRVWADAPHDGFGGRSPANVIREELGRTG